ncbi:MAG: sulfatase, partial [Bacteroidota bacterium]|nr:sulfatase [Bacteroidota bacterium]
MKIFKCVIFSLTFVVSARAQQITEKPLNVVWISCEDMGPVLSAYGNKVVNTPNIDRLANEGVKYTNA